MSDVFVTEDETTIKPAMEPASSSADLVFVENLNRLDILQRRALQAVDAALTIAESGRDPTPIFITGPGGVGKSHLIHMIRETSRLRNSQCQVFAPTGLAAHLVNGVTLHYGLRIPVHYNRSVGSHTKQYHDRRDHEHVEQETGNMTSDHEKSAAKTSNIIDSFRLAPLTKEECQEKDYKNLLRSTVSRYTKKYAAIEQLCSTVKTMPNHERREFISEIMQEYDVLPLSLLDIVIIEEISQVSKKQYRLVLDMLQTFGPRPHLKTGGIVLVLVGDFYQLPPVPKDGEPVEYAFEAPEWNANPPIAFHLTKNWRQQHDGAWLSCLSRIRTGLLNGDDVQLLRSRLCPISNISLTSQDKTECSVIEPTRLYFSKKQVQECNSNATRKLLARGAQSTILTAKIHLDVYREGHRPFGTCIPVEDVLNKSYTRKDYDLAQSLPLNLREMLEHHAFLESETLLISETICVGSQVILTHNISVESGLVNGTRGTVVSLPTSQHNYVELCVLDPRTLEPRTEKVQVVEYRPKEPFVFKDGNHVMKFIVVGYPLLLASAMTIYRCQGQTIPRVHLGIQWRHRVDGCAYVGLGRCPSIAGLTLSSFDLNCITTSPKVSRFYQHLTNGKQAKYILQANTCNRQLQTYDAAPDSSDSTAYKIIVDDSKEFGVDCANNSANPNDLQTMVLLRSLVGNGGEDASGHVPLIPLVSLTKSSEANDAKRQQRKRTHSDVQLQEHVVVTTRTRHTSSSVVYMVAPEPITFSSFTDAMHRTMAIFDNNIQRLVVAPQDRLNLANKLVPEWIQVCQANIEVIKAEQGTGNWQESKTHELRDNNIIQQTDAVVILYPTREYNESTVKNMVKKHKSLSFFLLRAQKKNTPLRIEYVGYQ